MLRPPLATVVGRPRVSVDDLVRDLRARITDVVRTGWLSMTFGLVGFFGVYYVLFWFCLHAVGVHMRFGQIFAAYAVGRLLTAVGVTPGGAGRHRDRRRRPCSWPGAPPPADALAGVVLFSVYTHLMEIPLGRDRLAGLGPLAQAPPPDADRRPGPRVVRAGRRPHRASADRATPAPPRRPTHRASRSRRAGHGRLQRRPGRAGAVSRRAGGPGAAAPRRRWRRRPPPGSKSRAGGPLARPARSGRRRRRGLAGRIGPCR